MIDIHSDAAYLEIWGKLFWGLIESEVILDIKVACESHYLPFFNWIEKRINQPNIDFLTWSKKSVFFVKN